MIRNYCTSSLIWWWYPISKVVSYTTKVCCLVVSLISSDVLARDTPTTIPIPLSEDVFFNPATNCEWWFQNLIPLGDKSVEILLPQGSYRPDAPDSLEGGTGFIVDLKIFSERQEQITDAEFSYDITFPVDFDFVKGGKLPWFCGGYSCPRWGGEQDSGFSTRYMWRKGGKLELYYYGPWNPHTYWQSISIEWFRFIPGKKYTLSQRITLWTDGNNGDIRVFIDGAEVLNTTLDFWNLSDVGIDGVLFSVFYGGHDATWAANKDESLRIWNMKVEINK